MQVTFTKDIPFQRIDDLIITGVEGGTNYWMSVEGAWNESVWGDLEKTVKEGKLKFSNRKLADTDEDHLFEKVLTEEVIQQGLQLMADKHSRHFEDFMNENEDAITGDVFIQLCVLGEVRYG